MKIRTIKEIHSEWAAKIMPVGSSQIQRQEMERAFYSGAGALFGLVVGEITALDDDKAEIALGAVRHEITDYFRLLGKIPGPEGTSRQ